MQDADTQDLDIPDGLDEVVARLPDTMLSAWCVDVSRYGPLIEAWQKGEVNLRATDPSDNRRPSDASRWFVCSREAAAARLRFQDKLRVTGPEIDALRLLMPWIDASYDLVSTFDSTFPRHVTFWQMQNYEPIPEGTYLLECWYAVTHWQSSAVFGWKILNSGPAMGRVIHQEFDLNMGPDADANRARWGRIKPLLSVLDIYERDYPYFPGFAPGRAEGKRIVANVTLDMEREEDTGIVIPRERIHNLRGWVDPSRATYLPPVAT